MTTKRKQKIKIPEISNPPEVVEQAQTTYNFICPLCRGPKPSATCKDPTGLGFYVMRHFQATHPESKLRSMGFPQEDDCISLVLADGSSLKGTLFKS